MRPIRRASSTNNARSGELIELWCSVDRGKNQGCYRTAILLCCIPLDVVQLTVSITNLSSHFLSHPSSLGIVHLTPDNLMHLPSFSLLFLWVFMFTYSKNKEKDRNRGQGKIEKIVLLLTHSSNTCNNQNSVIS